MTDQKTRIVEHEFTENDAYWAVREAAIELDAIAHHYSYGKDKDMPKANRLRAQAEQLKYAMKFHRKRQHEINELNRQLSYARAK